MSKIDELHRDRWIQNIGLKQEPLWRFIKNIAFLKLYSLLCFVWHIVLTYARQKTANAVPEYHEGSSFTDIPSAKR